MNLNVVRADELFIYRLDVRIICSQLGANGMQMKLQICLRSPLMSVHLLFATVYTIGCKFLCNVSISNGISDLHGKVNVWRVGFASEIFR